MIKIIGALLIIFSSYFIGYSFSLKLLKRCKIMRQMENLCFEIGENIRLKSLPVELTVKNCLDGKSSLCFASSFPKIHKDNSLSVSDYNIITDFFSGLGQSDTAGQIKHCSIYKEIFSQLRAKYEKDDLPKTRITSSLGLAIGIGLAVIMI